MTRARYLAFTALFLLALPAGVWVAPRDGEAHPGPHHHALNIDRWYQTIAGGGVPYITLSTFTGYICGGTCTSNWTAVKNATIYNWNNSPTTAYFSETGTLAESNDVRSTVISGSYCPLHFGLTFCLPIGGLGSVWYLVEAGNGSHSSCGQMADCYPPGTQNIIRHTVAVLSDTNHSGFYGTQFQRQATMVHEFGHKLSLAHQYLGDGLCGTGSSPLQTAMDYDCLDLGMVNGPTSFDHCGVNHAYYDPAWGYSGC